MDDKDLADFDRFIEEHWGSSKVTVKSEDDSKTVKRAGSQHAEQNMQCHSNR